CEQASSPDNSAVKQQYAHVRPSWSPDGMSVAFTATVNTVLGIYLVDTSGANTRLVHAGDAIGITWSPDSKWIAFSQGRNLFRRKASGDSLVQITSTADDIRPAWSRDGKSIAYVHSTGVWLLDAATLAARQLVNAGDCPSWHPNGKEVVYLKVVFSSASNAADYRIDAVQSDSLTARTLTTIVSSYACSFVSINPVGGDLLFARTSDNAYAQVAKASVTNGVPVVLVDDGGDYPAWSPDGKKIVYTRTQQGDGALWIMNADGTGKRRLTSP
ncbi:MAG: PD40 domain-containing protein, partial [Ignavibacteriales bacterium]|nr:PD40 domain-containing protein [Ignavibacteriales bacterium]